MTQQQSDFTLFGTVGVLIVMSAFKVTAKPALWIALLLNAVLLVSTLQNSSLKTTAQEFVTKGN